MTHQDAAARAAVFWGCKRLSLRNRCTAKRGWRKGKGATGRVRPRVAQQPGMRACAIAGYTIIVGGDRDGAMPASWQVTPPSPAPALP